MSSTKVKFSEAKIDDALIQEARRFIGTKLRIENSVNNEEATRMAILKFANGIGDTNPLWGDPEYAANTIYGTLVAPPSWVFSAFSGVQYGFRGLGGFHSGNTLDFFVPILRNDRIAPQMTCTDVASAHAISLLGICSRMVPGGSSTLLRTR